MEHSLLDEAHRRALQYLDSLPHRRVGPTPDAIAGLAKLTQGPLPETGEDPHTLLAQLDELATPATVTIAGPRYFGFVNGGTLPAAQAAHTLASAWDQNAAMYAMSPAAVELERAAHRWLLDLLGLPPECGTGTTTGAQMANVTALAAARRAQSLKAGWDADRDGLFGAPPITVVVSDQTHSTVAKALAILGLGRNRVVTVPSDQQGRFRASTLPKLEGPAILCLQAGNVNSGAFDDFAELIPQAHEHGAWVHIDGAFGLWAAASPRYAHLTQGYAEADSWATDGHKTLNLPYDCGFVFIRDRQAQHGAMSLGGAYLASSQTAEPLWQTPDASRRARGIEAWMALRALGRQGVAELVDQLCARAAYFAQSLAKLPSVAILNDVVFNQVLVSFGSSERTKAMIAAIQADGTLWCGGTEWRGQAAMRISLSNWSTSEADIDQCVAAIARLLAAL
jgi:glutamate/tyrosine decarboxylase-like PLP-dependent enzyme